MSAGASQERTINVAFAGHIRQRDLLDPDRCTARLSAAFALLPAAGVTRARLLTGLAEGADTLAVAAWPKALGPIHLVQPFLNEPTSAVADAATRLDGEAARAAGDNPYVQQAQWLISYADLLIVLWNGAAARGPGGTAETVLLALERGLPVLWVAPAAVAPPVRLIQFQRRQEGFDLHELQIRVAAMNRSGSSAVIATAALLAPALGTDFDPPADPAEPRLQGLDRWLHRWLWKAFDSFKRRVGGRSHVPASPAPPDDLAADPGFHMLNSSYRATSDRARRLAAVHRSEQLLLLVAAVAAAIVGTAPAVWPEFKIYAVLLELSLALAAFFVWLSASRAHRHEAWGNARRLVERMRAQRAGWAIGATLMRGEDHASERNAERRALRLLSASGVPSGAFDADRVKRWGDWAIADLIGGQAAYHAEQARLNHRISRRIQLVENGTFVLLILVLAAFATAYFAAASQGLHLSHFVGGAVVMIGAIVPAIGAACMAMEAKLGFEEQHERSAHLETRFNDLMAQARPELGLAQRQDLLRRAMRLMENEAETWREGAERRRLFRGG